jgi:mono/diheme cytochrome c family protein
MRFIAGFVAALVVLTIGALAVTYLGLYNVAASVPDAGPVKWLLEKNMEHSVARHARRVTVPAQLTDEQARQGASIYKDTCVLCHGAPGKDPANIGKGLNPEAPYLPDTAGEWTTAQLFWIIKNGIKMTAMASYGAVYKDEEVWTLVAFVQRLPKMSPEQYGQMAQAAAAPR